MPRQTAILIGATGLVGSHLLDLLLMSDSYSLVKIFVRSPTGIVHPRLEEHVVDLAEPDAYSEKIVADHLFCCIGTTIKKVGSREEFRKVDFLIPVRWAEVACRNKVSKFLVVSSIGVKTGSSNFYLQTKKEMEEAVQAFPFRSVHIFRPSFLAGERKEFRMREKAGILLARLFSVVLIGGLKKYRPIHVSAVALAMKRVALSDTAQEVFESHTIQEIAEKGITKPIPG